MPKHASNLNTKIFKYAKTLRKNMTEEERILWSVLRRYSLHFRFRRQYVIGSYIVDFVCLEKMLVIELDGSQHFEHSALIYDEKRTRFIEMQGFRVLRFSNREIRHNLANVLEVIYFYLTGDI